MLIVAEDRGVGNTKICINGQVSVVQSAVTRPQQLGLAAIGMRVSQRPREVSFGGFNFGTGGGAWNWGPLANLTDYISLVGPERLALFYTGIAELLPHDTPLEGELVIGVPVTFLKDEDQARPLLDQLKYQMKTQHLFQVDGRAYDITFRSLRVAAQPLGAYIDWLLDDDLKPRSSNGKMKTAVLDIGMNTLDLYVVQNGQVLPGFLGGDKLGVRRLLALLNTNGHTTMELDSDLRLGQLKPGQNEISIWLNDIFGAVDGTWPNLRNFDALIPVGGGVKILGEQLRSALASKGAAVHWPEDPIVANARGLWKWATRYKAMK